MTADTSYIAMVLPFLGAVEEHDGDDLVEATIHGDSQQMVSDTAIHYLKKYPPSRYGTRILGRMEQGENLTWQMKMNRYRLAV